MTAPVIFPPGQATPLGAARMLSGVVPEVSLVGVDGTKWYLQGGKSPELSCEDGIGLLGTEGLQAPMVLLDEQGARQDGITNLDTVFDPAVIKLYLEASGVTPASLRRTVRTWISTWNPPNVNTLSVFTQDFGEWWMPVRQRKPIPDQLDQDPSLHRRLRFMWECRGDNAFWQGPDSVSVFPGGAYPGAIQSLTDGAGSGFVALTNLGTRPVFPRYLLIGPGTFSLGNGALPSQQGAINVGQPVTFGPLSAGQMVAIYTDPRLRSVVDLSANQPAQSLNIFQTLIQDLINAAVGNYPVPPQLQAYESLFGILPPNGPMYSLLTGRFTSLSQVPPKQDGYAPQTTWIPVSISGGNTDSKIVAAITPQRTWPW